jgi:hypothetical protein
MEFFQDNLNFKNRLYALRDTKQKKDNYILALQKPHSAPMELDNFTFTKSIVYNQDYQVYYSVLYLEKILDLLDDDKADDYTTWLKIGKILYNLTRANTHGLQLWIKFSKCSRKYLIEECEDMWSRMKLETTENQFKDLINILYER